MNNDLDKNNKEDNQEIKKEEIQSENSKKKEKENAQFPDWDILPPNQIINPRIKNQ